MKNLIILFLALILFSAYTLKEEKQVLSPMVLWYAVHTGCDEYKVFYQVDNGKLKTKKGSLIQLLKLGFDVREVVMICNDN